MSSNNHKGAEDAPNMRTVSFFPSHSQLPGMAGTGSTLQCICVCVSVCVTKPISTMESHLNLHKVTAVKVCDACDINETSTMRICECQARERGRAGEGEALPVQLVEFAAVWSEVPYSNQSRKHKLYLKKQI